MCALYCCIVAIIIVSFICFDYFITFLIIVTDFIDLSENWPSRNSKMEREGNLITGDSFLHIMHVHVHAAIAQTFMVVHMFL